MDLPIKEDNPLFKTLYKHILTHTKSKNNWAENGEEEPQVAHNKQKLIIKIDNEEKVLQFELPYWIDSEKLEDFQQLLIQIGKSFQYIEQAREALTQREWEVLNYIAQGKSSNEISAELGLSPFTILAHRRNIKSKLSDEYTTTLKLMQIYQG